MGSNVIMPDDQGSSRSASDAQKGAGAAPEGILAGLATVFYAWADYLSRGGQSSQSGASGSGGFFSTLWRAVSRHFELLLIPSVLLAFFLILTNVYGIHVWPLFLLTEISAVWLGLAFGWACIKEDLKRVEDPDPQDFDSLGFFYSRIASRSPLLFEITTAQRALKTRHAARSAASRRFGARESTPTTPPAPRSGVDDARDLVRSYWEPDEEDQPSGNDGERKK